MANKIDSVSSRDRLKPRRAPYWHKLATGCYLGFRKMTSDSTGTWVIRYREGDKQVFKALGSLDQFPAYERFDRAAEEARTWFTHLSRGGSTGRHTVGDCCRAYLAHIRQEKGDRPAADAEGRFKRWIFGTPLEAVELAKLTREHMKGFRKLLMGAPVTVKEDTRKRAPGSVNRDLTVLRAALNLALAEGKVTTDFAWREPLKPIKGAVRRRDLYLDKQQRRALIEHAAPDVGNFLRGLSLLPLRPGALAGLNAGHYNARLKTLRIGMDKAGKDRQLIVQGATADFLAQQARGKDPDAPLFTRADGARWNKDAWKDPIKEAVSAAGLPPETTAYTLRHSVITDLVVGGLDLLTVAQVSGTSVAMIEKHYGHLRQSIAALALEKLAL